MPIEEHGESKSSRQEERIDESRCVGPRSSGDPAGAFNAFENDPGGGGRGGETGRGRAVTKGWRAGSSTRAIKNLFDDPSAPRRRVVGVANRGKRKTRRTGWRRGEAKNKVAIHLSQKKSAMTAESGMSEVGWRRWERDDGERESGNCWIIESYLCV